VEEVKSTGGSRRYRSTVREEGARRTRQAIVAAATELFATRGYVAASLSDIAATAGVARPTVTAAFGAKPVLLRQALDQALAGDDEPVAVADRPWFRPVWDATTHHDALVAYAHVCTVIGQRAGRLFEAVRRAADASPDVADLWQTTRRNRRAGAAMVVDHVVELGPLPSGLGREAAVDAVWFFNDPGHYEAMVRECSWPESDFTAWLASRLQDAVIGRPPA
jgi:AcrR family transcriptional regulator